MRFVVNSRLIREIDYKFSTEILTVLMVDNTKNVFTMVPQFVIREFIMSNSPGEFYLENIRTRFSRTTIPSRTRIFSDYFRSISIPLIFLLSIGMGTALVWPIIDWAVSNSHNVSTKKAK